MKDDLALHVERQRARQVKDDLALHVELEIVARRAALFCAQDDRTHPALDPDDEQETIAENLPPGDRHATLPDPTGWQIPPWAHSSLEMDDAS